MLLEGFKQFTKKDTEYIPKYRLFENHITFFL